MMCFLLIIVGNRTLSMQIESFFPGRVRVNSPLFRIQENAERAKIALVGQVGVASVEANLRTGSLTILYDARVISMEMLLAAKAEMECWEDPARNSEP